MHDTVCVSDPVSHEHAHDHSHAHAQGGPHAHPDGGSHQHSHDTPHPHGTPDPYCTLHSHGTPDPHAPEQAPENVDNLILDIGADTGALVIQATADRDQAEIEISPAGGEQARTHNIVRRREALSGAVYAAVFPALAAGDYVVWRDATTAAGTVVVHGGRVASFRLK